MRSNGRAAQPVRWAVAGLGHIAQIAVLPAFAHAKPAARLVALLSDDPKKQRVLARRHGISHVGDYAELRSVVKAGDVDAVYVALPNHLHCAFVLRALAARAHVLCEKPMAVTSAECQRMIEAADRHDRRLMIAYRLHFERANLAAIERARSGELGDVHHVQGFLTLAVQDPKNIRLGPRAKGGGPLYDLGIYCLNAGRYIFRAEPTEVMAWPSERRTRAGAEQRMSAVLRFPGDRDLTFTASVASAPVSELRLIGTKGDLRVENAFDYAEPIHHSATTDDETRERTFARRDQFAAELVYFSECIRSRRQPEPSGREGLADVRVIEALYASARTRRPFRLPAFIKVRRPTLEQAITRPAVRRPPRQVNARSPSAD